MTVGIMVISLRFGRCENQDRSVTEQPYATTQELMRLFEARHGSCLCMRLLNGCNLNTEAGRASFKEQDLLHKTCEPCVRTVADILDGMLKG